MQCKHIYIKFILIMTLEKESKKEQVLWLEEAIEKWKDMEWGERQHWLLQVADEHFLPKMKFVMNYKHFDFDKIPNEYQKKLAQKWGLSK